MYIGIVDIGIGNLGSLRSVLSKLNLDYKNCTENNDFENIEKILLPGLEILLNLWGFKIKIFDKTIIKKA